MVRRMCLTQHLYILDFVKLEWSQECLVSVKYFFYILGSSLTFLKENYLNAPLVTPVHELIFA